MTIHRSCIQATSQSICRPAHNTLAIIPITQFVSDIYNPAVYQSTVHNTDGNSTLKLGSSLFYILLYVHSHFISIKWWIMQRCWLSVKVAQCHPSNQSGATCFGDPIMYVTVIKCVSLLVTVVMM